MNVSTEVLCILEQCECKGNLLYLPKVQLERKLYLAVNKVLEAAGGRWSRKEKAHVFDSDPGDIIETIILTGSVVDKKREFQFFETPLWLVDEMIAFANIVPGDVILEPSAGKGRIVSRLKELYPNNKVACCELETSNYDSLVTKGFYVAERDFFKYEEKVDKIIANPPFSKQQDIDHITHMIEVCREGGRIVTIASPGITFRENNKTKTFRNLLESMKEYFTKKLPEGTFKESGTMVRAVLLVIDK